MEKETQKEWYDDIVLPPGWKIIPPDRKLKVLRPFRRENPKPYDKERSAKLALALKNKQKQIDELMKTHQKKEADEKKGEDENDVSCKLSWSPDAGLTPSSSSSSH